MKKEVKRSYTEPQNNQTLHFLSTLQKRKSTHIMSLKFNQIFGKKKSLTTAFEKALELMTAQLGVVLVG